MKNQRWFYGEKQIDEIKSRLKKLSRIELEYFRSWLMNHYPIWGMGHDIDTMIDTMDGVGAEYVDIVNMLKNIGDHSKWEIDESHFLEEEKRGVYTIWDVQELMEKLSWDECERFMGTLIEKFPIYKKEKISEYNFYYLNNTFGDEGFPRWEEALKILKELKK